MRGQEEQRCRNRRSCEQRTIQSCSTKEGVTPGSHSLCVESRSQKVASLKRAKPNIHKVNKTPTPTKLADVESSGGDCKCKERATVPEANAVPLKVSVVAMLEKTFDGVSWT